MVEDKTVYDVHMNGTQMDIIHKALNVYTMQRRMLQNISPEEEEMVGELFDMSDRSSTNNKPEPLPVVNGWCL